MSDLSPSSKRSTSHSFMPAVRGAAFALAFVEALSFGIGVGRDVWGTGGSSLVLPFVAAPVFAILLGVGWHIVTQMAVDAKTTLDRVFTFGCCGLLSGFGILLSGAYLLSLIAGNSAQQQNETVYLVNVKAAYSVASENAVLESGIAGPVKAAHLNLGALAEREAVGKGVTDVKGRKKVYGELVDSQSMFSNLLNVLDGKGKARAEGLATAFSDLQAAETASAAFDHAGFQDAVASFAMHLNKTDAIQSASSLAGIAAGLLSGDARRVVDETIRVVRDAVQGLTQKRKAIALKPYHPLDAMHAVLAYPQPIPIAICLSLELICWLLVCLLMLLPRKQEGAEETKLLPVQAMPMAPQPPLYERAEQPGKGSAS